MTTHKCTLLLGCRSFGALCGAEAHLLDVVEVFEDYAVTVAGNDDGGRWIFMESHPIGSS